MSKKGGPKLNIRTFISFRKDAKHIITWTDILRVSMFWAVLCIAFYWEVIRSPATYIVGGNDLNNMFRIWMDYARSRLLNGQLPLWNPYLFSGHSFISDPQPALFYPPTWLSIFLNPTQGLGWTLALHIWWAAVGCTLWLRSIRIRDGRNVVWGAALAGAAVFAFSGYTYARIQAGHIGVLTTGSWLPWALWALTTLSYNLRWQSVAGGAVCVAFSILAGHTATFIYIAILLVAYTIMLAWHKQSILRKKYLFLVAAMGVLGLALASIQMLPMLDIIISSTRLGSSDYTFASRFSWPAGYVLTLLVPNFFGEPVRTGYWGDGVYDEMIFYVGVLPLMLLWVASRIRSDSETRKHATFWLGVAAVSLLTALGSHGILHRLLFRFIPLFSNMRAPARAGFLFTVSAAALTALSLHTLSQSDKEERQHLLQSFTPNLFTIVIVVTTVVVVISFGLFAWGKGSNPEAGRFFHLANETAVFGIFFCIAFGWLRQSKGDVPGPKYVITALILILLDLWTLGSRLVEVVPAPLSSYWERVADYTGADTGRILPWGLSIFEQNGALSYKIRSVFGYNPLEDGNYNRYITINPDPRARIYDILNVTHVATTVPIPLEPDDTLALKTEKDGIFIYQRTTSLPPVWIPDNVIRANEDDILNLINDPQYDLLTTAFIESKSDCPYQHSGEVQITPPLIPEILQANVKGEGGLVVFSERYASGWEATLDGEKVPIIKANGILRAVCVPPGEFNLEMRYRPTLLTVGLLVSLGSLLSLGVIFLVPRFRKNIPQ